MTDISPEDRKKLIKLLEEIETAIRETKTKCNKEQLEILEEIEKKFNKLSKGD